MIRSTYSFRGISLPLNLKDSIDAFVENGRPTGSFLQACINNNLREAFGRADETSLAVLPAILGYFYNECPIGCWGFAGAYEKWIREKREERQGA